MYIADMSRPPTWVMSPGMGRKGSQTLTRAGSERTWCSAAAGCTTPTWYFPSARSCREAARPDLTVSHSAPGEMGSTGSITEGTRETPEDLLHDGIGRYFSIGRPRHVAGRAIRLSAQGLTSKSTHILPHDLASIGLHRDL